MCADLHLPCSCGQLQMTHFDGGIAVHGFHVSSYVWTAGQPMGLQESCQHFVLARKTGGCSGKAAAKCGRQLLYPCAASHSSAERFTSLLCAMCARPHICTEANGHAAGTAVYMRRWSWPWWRCWLCWHCAALHAWRLLLLPQVRTRP